MQQPCHNLLTEPLLSVTGGDSGAESMSLPGVLASLSAGTALEFPRLQAHQQHAWHAFLVQLAALALSRGGLASAEWPRQEDRWRALLRDLCDGRDEPFCLLVPDLAQPAFFQPPVPEASLEGFQEPIETPDELDVLITAKNFDVKQRRMASPRPEHWAYALVSLQSMQGYSGRGNYGISRMNGGSGSRPCVGIARDMGSATRFQRDVRLWLARREDLLDIYQEDGPALLWRHSWDGETSLPLPELDPFFIEICRRIRLITDHGRIRARFKPTASALVDSGENQGRTGDLWMPIHTDERGNVKAFTAGSQGLTYRVLADLIANQGYQTPALDARPEDGHAPYFLAEVLVRGQGKTEGLHHKEIPIPTTAWSLMGRPDGRKLLHNTIGEHVKRASEVQKDVLFPALMAILNGGEDRPRARNDQRPRRWTDEFDRRVGSCFFEHVWPAFERRARGEEPEDTLTEWIGVLVSMASEVLEQAAREAPIASVRRIKASSVAEQIFRGCARKHFANVFPSRSQEP